MSFPASSKPPVDGPAAPSSSSARSRGRRGASRSVRRIAAILLVLVALASALVVVIVGKPLLIPGLVVAAVAVVIGTRLLIDETTQVRREWARDRALQAHQNTREASARAKEHRVFAEHMAGNVRAGRLEIERLLGDLVQAQAAVANAQQAHAAAVQRADALESELEETKVSLAQSRAELSRVKEALGASQADEEAARAELLAWQEAQQARRLA